MTECRYGGDKATSMGCRPRLAEEQSYYLGWVIAALFLPMSLELGLTGFCLGSPALRYIDWQKYAEITAVRGKHAPGPGD